MTYGIRKAIAIPTLMESWGKIKATGLGDRVSIRVFEGDLYSLMDDEDFYEEKGCRKLINILTSTWDCLRADALGEEPLNWGSRKIKRTPEEQEKLNEKISHFDRWMFELPFRVEY